MDMYGTGCTSGYNGPQMPEYENTKKRTGRSRQFLLPHPPPSIRVWDVLVKTNLVKAVTPTTAEGSPSIPWTSLQFRVSTPGESEAGGPSPGAGFDTPHRRRAAMSAVKWDWGQYADTFN